MQNYWWGRPLLPEILGQTDRVGAKSPIFDVFSPVAPQPYTSSEKSFIITNIGSPQRAFQWAQDEHRTLSLPPERVAQKRKVFKIWTISCDNSSTAYEIGCQLLLITNRKSRIRAFDWYRPRWPWMTLNDLERHNSPFCVFTEFDCFAGQIRHSGWI